MEETSMSMEKFFLDHPHPVHYGRHNNRDRRLISKEMQHIITKGPCTQKQGITVRTTGDHCSRTIASPLISNDNKIIIRQDQGKEEDLCHQVMPQKVVEEIQCLLIRETSIKGSLETIMLKDKETSNKETSRATCLLSIGAFHRTKIMDLQKVEVLDKYQGDRGTFHPWEINDQVR